NRPVQRPRLLSRVEGRSESPCGNIPKTNRVVNSPHGYRLSIPRQGHRADRAHPRIERVPKMNLCGPADRGRFGGDDVNPPPRTLAVLFDNDVAVSLPNLSPLRIDVIKLKPD